MEHNWTRKKYESWDEAFKALSPIIRQQSVRVAAYTQVIFAQACAASFYGNIEAGAERIKGKNADLAYKCGLYHQLGKALVPPEYQIWMSTFTEEEQAVYRKYTSDGRILVAMLQERGARLTLKKSTETEEADTKNVSWLMLREACQQHMEHWDGTGYPEARKGDEISPIAQIVGLAKELDRLASETKSENPFGEAFEVLTAEAGKKFSPELIEILKACRGKCRNVYRKYINYTLTLPKTIPLVEKRKDRPMGLNYRPMVRGREGYVAAYEAVPWFGGLLDRPGETESLEEVEGLLQRTKLIEEITMYYLYEAADTVLRIQNCKLPMEGILVPVLAEFYTGADRMNKLKQLYEDQPIDKRMMMLTMPASVITDSTKESMNFITKIIDDGIPIVLDNYRPADLPIERVREIGISRVRLAPDLYLSQETANTMTILKNYGFQILGAGADSHDIIDWLDASGVSYMSGILTGTVVTENELIRDMLLREQ